MKRALKNYAGLKSNKLTAIELIERVNDKTYWLFKCDCGNEKKIIASKVFDKKSPTKSCGCAMQSKTKKTDDSRALKQLYKNYKRNANKRNYVFCLQEYSFKKITSLNCFYCGSEPKNISKYDLSIYKYNGIDRVNNDLGYLESNCVPCCKICNSAKGTMKVQDFYTWIKNISDFIKINIIKNETYNII